MRRLCQQDRHFSKEHEMTVLSTKYTRNRVNFCDYRQEIISWNNPRELCEMDTQVHLLAPLILVASTKCDPGFEFGSPDWSGSWCSPDRSQNVVDSFPCRHQSFRRVLWKAADDCMINANEYPKMSYLQCWGSGKVIWNPYPRPDYHRSILPIDITNDGTVNETKNWLITFAVIVLIGCPPSLILGV